MKTRRIMVMAVAVAVSALVFGGESSAQGRGAGAGGGKGQGIQTRTQSMTQSATLVRQGAQTRTQSATQVRPEGSQRRDGSFLSTGTTANGSTTRPANGRGVMDGTGINHPKSTAP
jgi:hypothetical protein